LSDAFRTEEIVAIGRDLDFVVYYASDTVGMLANEVGVEVGVEVEVDDDASASR